MDLKKVNAPVNTETYDRNEIDRVDREVHPTTQQDAHIVMW